MADCDHMLCIGQDKPLFEESRLFYIYFISTRYAAALYVKKGLINIQNIHNLKRDNFNDVKMLIIVIKLSRENQITTSVYKGGY